MDIILIWVHDPDLRDAWLGGSTTKESDDMDGTYVDEKMAELVAEYGPGNVRKQIVTVPADSVHNLFATPTVTAKEST